MKDLSKYYYEEEKLIEKYGKKWSTLSSKDELDVLTAAIENAPEKNKDNSPKYVSQTWKNETAAAKKRKISDLALRQFSSKFIEENHKVMVGMNN